MKRSSFFIVIAMLLLAAFILCVALVQRSAENEGETFFVQALQSTQEEER